LRGSAVTAIDQRAGFVKAGQTERGTLWRIESETIADRPALSDTQQATMRAVTGAQLLVVLAAILLSIPTRASRRAARSRSRIVGRAPEEPLVLPRRRGAARDDDDAADADLDDPEMSAAEPDEAEGTGTSLDAPAPRSDADTTADEHPDTDPSTDPDTDRDAPSTQPEEAR
jgi:alkanesulfonate monooxygenase SsuD/methylene tetrahydromethanopterin reductase-like flavin-dependent oxidoreductase (luciferase family)